MSVFFYGCVTMDGFLANKNHGLDWLHETGSTEETGYEAFYQKMDVTIMGRRTFDEIARLEEAASVYPTTANYVFTHSDSLPQEGYVPVRGDAAEFVSRLEPDRNIWIIGGNTILAPLLDANLVDHLIIQIAPVLLGEGVPLFAQRDAVRRFMVDFPAGKIIIMQFDGSLERMLERHVIEKTNIPLSTVKDCYNLMLKAAPLMLTRQGSEDTFQIIWPEQVSFAIGERESFWVRRGDKLYFSAWEEEPEYREEIIVRKLETGEIIGRFPGSSMTMPDGRLWILT